ncbi:MAG: hypothetical protein CSA81_09365 [Acidobacteria bacterium]|nr:MAG: hypothetical protein CSA81_09365 [Acidobacteriota bacterium]
MNWSVLVNLALAMVLTEPSGQLEPLELISVLPIESQGRKMDLSALTLVDGELYTLSDKENGVIYRLAFQENHLVLLPYRDCGFSREVDYDFEGLTADDQGNFFMISERQSRVMCMPADGSPCHWVIPSLKREANKKNLLKLANGGFEGIAYLGNDLFVACAERNERGLVSWRIDRENPDRVQDLIVVNGENTTYGKVKHRSLDLSGLCFYKGKLLAIHRNNSLVSVISGYREGCFVEEKAWSYWHVEYEPEYRFKDKRYGLAEGIAIDDDRIYLVLDPNRDSREKYPDDYRSLLFVFKKPAEL